MGPTTTVIGEVPAIPLASGQEISNLCFSWTVGNAEPLYVNRVRMTATSAGIHHSNWYFVPADTYPGEDGLWPCRDRGFNTVGAATAGGVLFGQSTQNVDEVQQFRPGAALTLPPNSVVVADLHLINTTPDDTDVGIGLEMTAIDEADLTTPLTGFSFDYYPLAIPPRSRAEFSTTCEMALSHRRALMRPLDFSVHYVLPHYHALGTFLRLEVVGGPNDGQVIWETRNPIGEPLGGPVEPPLSLEGAEAVRLTCGYDNPTDREVGWGIGDQEMCVAFGFSDSERLWAGSTMRLTGSVVGERDGVILNEADTCLVINAAPAE